VALAFPAPPSNAIDFRRACRAPAAALAFAAPPSNAIDFRRAVRELAVAAALAFAFAPFARRAAALVFGAESRDDGLAAFPGGARGPAPLRLLLLRPKFSIFPRNSEEEWKSTWL
jgi:hypothetical protein|tara:strand:- start:111 stop:455 length:345 start_codon:yes stop_codon:yes gene_type:complete